MTPRHSRIAVFRSPLLTAAAAAVWCLQIWLLLTERQLSSQLWPDDIQATVVSLLGGSVTPSVIGGPVVETVQAVPISPAGWGVAEGMYVVLLGEQGVTHALALTLALAVRGVTLSQAALGVPLLLGLLRRGEVAGVGGRAAERA